MYFIWLDKKEKNIRFWFLFFEFVFFFFVGAWQNFVNLWGIYLLGLDFLHVF